MTGLLLAIESSCDETAAAVIDDEYTVREEAEWPLPKVEGVTRWLTAGQSPHA